MAVDSCGNLRSFHAAEVVVTDVTGLVADVLHIRFDQGDGQKVIDYVLSCRRSNTPEWMEGLVKVINKYAKEVGDSDRVTTLRDGLQVITQQDVEETRPDK